jgi:hypothetical protein
MVQLPRSSKQPETLGVDTQGSVLVVVLVLVVVAVLTDVDVDVLVLVVVVVEVDVTDVDVVVGIATPPSGSPSRTSPRAWRRTRGRPRAP